MKTVLILSALCLSGGARAQTATVTPGGPVVPPVTVAVDPVARAMAQEALTLASRRSSRRRPWSAGRPARR